MIVRLFTLAAEGHGLIRIAKRLNAEGALSPNGKWKPTGVREVLKRDLYRGVVVYGKPRRALKKGKKTRVRVPESEWKHREAPELRIVPDDLWQAAHARMAETASSFLRRNGKLVGQVENLGGKYLLSGFLACGVCGGNLGATVRGRNNVLAYLCQTHKTVGTCENSTAVPMARLHEVVLASLQETFSEANFAHFQRTRAADERARPRGRPSARRSSRHCRSWLPPSSGS